MDSVYTKVHELDRDCDHVLDLYEQQHRDGRRAAVLMGYVDKWDEAFGKGFFVRQTIKRKEKRERKQ